MKKHEDIQRFYFFDYLFWIGKNFQYIVGRMDGDCVLLLYLMSVIFLPLESLGFCLFPKNNQTVLFGWGHSRPFCLHIDNAHHLSQAEKGSYEALLQSLFQSTCGMDYRAVAFRHNWRNIP